ncbi:LysR family transcriptional regulator [Alkalimonas amylolytica]|uniref:DNA-binding transcriptional regulator, LysR family n=1 Tax=Alkalimonas amylolytica TaxID=152573 RepID=A0A1H4CJM9_ALKAM|nr:LysR family transcriptional regulator [Alkalimonas amylolytica]SEA60567.1 DNA-binding transcriptional regulator, LysR family [Alkalimonas amylolytica]
MESLNLKSLECFQAILQTGSATAAAKQLAITQPAVSRLIQVLEQQLGFALFYREHSRLTPTDEARYLEQEISLLLSSVDRFKALADSVAKSELGSLKIVAPASFSAGPLASVIASFMEQYPSVSLSIDAHSPQMARELVAHRSVDCGFIQLPETHPGLVCQHLLSSNLVCAVPSKHPLAQAASIALTQLAAEPLIMLGQGRPTRVRLENEFKKAGVSMQVRLETHTVATACAYVKKGLGIAILNQVLAEQYCDQQMVLVPLLPDIQHQYGFIYSAYAPMPRLVARFYQHCLMHFSASCPAEN